VFVDTNILVRLLTRDDARQTAAAERFIEGGAWVPALALAETIWVLESVYGSGAGDLGKEVEMLLHHDRLVLQDEDAVTAALGLFQKTSGVGFSDCLMLEFARKAGHLPFGIFDHDLSKADGADKL